MSNRFTFPIATDHMPGGWHAAYAEVYERLLSPLRKSACRIMEIGCAGGGAIMSYAEYFPNAHCYSLDIHEKPDVLCGHDRIEHLQMDAYTDAALRRVGENGTLAAIFEDGPHSIESQEFFIQHWPKLLDDDGIAIVEDIAEHAHIARLARLVPPEFFCYGVDLTMHDEGRYDNRLMIIQRR